MSTMCATRSRRRLAAVTVLFVVLVAGGCSGTPEVSGSRLLVIGDSLLAQSEQPVKAALEADQWQVVVEGIPGADVGDWVEPARTYATFIRPGAVVVELGTNNCLSGSCDGLGTQIDTLMTELTKTADAVFWLNVQELPTARSAMAGEINDEISSAAGRWPEMVVVDMDERFREHPEWHDPDGLHLNPAGQLQLADLIRDALHDSSPAA